MECCFDDTSGRLLVFILRHRSNGHACAVVGERLYVFGGGTSSEDGDSCYLRDLFSLSCEPPHSDTLTTLLYNTGVRAS